MTDAHPYPPTGADRPLEPGTVVKDRYVLGAQLGDDRSGPIFEARDTALSQARGREQLVALQLLPAGLGGDEHRLERLKAEFVRVRSLSHPNISRVLDLASDEHGYFVTMELLEGASVAAILDEVSSEPLSKAEALAIVRAVGEALAYAHQRGIVHGEVDPESVFVTVDYEVKIKGFLRVRDELDPGALALPRSAGPDPRDDVRALARLACRLLAEADGDSDSDAGAGRVPKPSRIRGLTRKQRRTLTRALAPEREKRFANMRAFLAGLDIGDAEPLAHAVEAPAAEARTRWVAAAAVLVIAIGVTAAWFTRERIAATGAALQARVASMIGGPETSDAGGADAARPGVADALRPAAPDAELAAGAESSPAARADGLEPIELGPAATRMPTAPAAPGDSAQAAPADAAGSPRLEPLPALEPASDQSAADVRAGEPRGEAPGPGSGQGPSPAARDDPPPAVPEPSAPLGSVPPVLRFVEDSVTVRESAGAARLTVRRADTQTPATIAWWTVDGTATAADDFADLGRVVEEFPAGERDLVLLIPIVSDSMPEGDETFEVQVVEAVSEDDVASSSLRARVTIVDDD